MTRLHWWCVAAVLAAMPLQRVRAQADTGAVASLDVGSEREQLLRVLQLTGDVPFYPWSIRALSPGEEDRLAAMSARARAMLPSPGRVVAWGPARAALLPIQSTFIYNSTYAFGYNDGPIWAGRGITGALQGGVAGRFGPLSFQLEPEWFEAQNAAFPLHNASSSFSPYGDELYPGVIDHPQRFGPSAYGRLDPGQSSIRLDAGLVEGEFSTANQWWGPAIENPIILGDNAAGFPHVDIGTSHPLNIFIGAIHGRVIYGRLEQSAYSPDHGADSVRFAAGAIGEFIPRWIPGLEIGADRFFHSGWPANGIFHAPFGEPFRNPLNSRSASASDPTGNGPENQLAEIFARWAFPGHGLEVYGAFGKDDYNANIRDVIEEPDHESGYMLGAQRAWARGPESITTLRAEVMNMRIPPDVQGRGETAWYVHFGGVNQGHTELGQILGSEWGLGGGAALLALDHYHAQDRWTVEWARLMRAESARYPQPAHDDVEHMLSAQWLRTRGALAIVGAMAGIYDFNRNFGSDQFNLNLTAKLTYNW